MEKLKMNKVVEILRKSTFDLQAIKMQGKRINDMLEKEMKAEGKEYEIVSTISMNDKSGGSVSDIPVSA